MKESLEDWDDIFLYKHKIKNKYNYYKYNIILNNNKLRMINFID